MGEEQKTQEEQEQQKQTLGNQLGEQAKHAGGRIAKEAVKKGGKKAIVASKAAIVLMGKLMLILILVSLAATLFTMIAKAIIDFLVSDKMDQKVTDILTEYCTIDNDGIHFNKEDIVAGIKEMIADDGLDLNDLGFGSTKFSSEGNQLTVGGNVPKTEVSQAEEYLYKYMSASLKSELPYIEGSDKEVQGIIRIYRQKEENKDPIELEYLGYEKFKELLESDAIQDKQEVYKYYSLDENWNICIAKSSRKEVTYERYQGGVDIQIGSIDKMAYSERNVDEEYTVREVRIPYKGMISQYSMPFEFLYRLLVVTKNPNYVSAVADLVDNSSQIDLTIFDSTTITTYVDKYKYAEHRRWTQVTKGDPNAYAAAQQVDTTEQKSSDIGYVEVDRVVREETSIKANVTVAKTWAIDQVTKYIAEKKPLETTVDEKPSLEDETDPGGDDATWRDKKEQTIKETVNSVEWMKEADTDTKIDESLFLGLWKNDTGTYVKGAKYNPDGKVVAYNLPTGIEPDKPTRNILSAEEYLYTLFMTNTKTQTHAELIKYFIYLYRNGKKLDNIDEITFKPREFLEADWNRIGSGFWWPMNDTTITRVTSPYGPRNINVPGASKFHKGIDIGAPSGSEVIATADGTVEIADDNSEQSSGKWIKITHSNGVKSAYLHLSKVLVRKGQKVKQGDVIALSGNTGIGSGPHLDFRIEVNGEYVDPLNYVDPNNSRPTGVFVDIGTVEEWRDYIYQAFAELGYTATEEKVNALLRQIKTESSGNQFILQGIKDSNSGTRISIGDGTCPWCPSPGGSCGNTNIGHGLLQFIPTTFYNNMVQGHTNIFNGYDQICNCISMLEKRAGTYTNYIGKGTGWG